MRTSRRGGLRLRIAATIAGLVVVTVAALGVGVHLLVVENRVQQARAAAATQLAAALQIRAATGLLSFDARVDDPALPAELRRAVERDGARATLVSGGSTRRIWAAGRDGNEVLSTSTVFRPADAGVRDVDRALLLAGLAAVLLATVAGALSANRLSRRLRLAARTARTVADSAGGDGRAAEAIPALRSAVGPGRDEVGDLADAVDAMADRLAERLRSEQRFTADVAHDLRTPVTGLLAAAALLDDSRPAVLVRDRARALAVLVEELLEVARLDSGVETAELEHVRLPDLVARAVQRGAAKGEYAADDVTVDVRGEPVVVLTDPRRLERVLSNLVRNARRHGAPPVVVQVRANQVVVRDHGPGFDARLLELGPERARSTTPGRGGGHGLGLVIAAGQAAVLGSPLRLGNAVDGGAEVVLELPDGGPPRERNEAQVRG